MALETEKVFQDIEKSGDRQEARTAHAERVAAWKAEWGFVDDTLLEVSDGRRRGDALKGGSKDDSFIEHRPAFTPVKPSAPKKTRPTVAGLSESIEKFEASMARRRAKAALDRTAMIDQVSGDHYSKTRRSALEELTSAPGQDAPHYLAREYGMRTARDEKAELRSGPRIDHEQSAVYMRDNPGDTTRMFKDLFKKQFPDRTLKNVRFVNSPKILDRLELFYGSKFLPAPEERRIDQLAPGIYALQCEPPEIKGGFLGEEGIDAFTQLLQSLGSTPSSYQAFKALHEAEGAVPLSPVSLDNSGALERLKSSPAISRLEAVPASHPMAQIAKVSASLLGNLPGAPELAPADPPIDISAMEAVDKSQAQQQKAEAREALRLRIETLKSHAARLGKPWERGKYDLKLKRSKEDAELSENINNIGKGIGDAEAALKDLKCGQCANILATVEALLPAALSSSYERDPLVQDSLANLERLATAMEALVDDAARTTRIFDLIIDELYLFLARTRPYDKKAFDDAVKKTLEKRAPSIKSLKNAKPKSFLVSSGMDALSTGIIAAMKNHEAGDVNLLGGGNENYFEVAELLTHSDSIKVTGDIIVATLNPSTPTAALEGATAPPSQVAKILAAVQAELEKKVRLAISTGITDPISIVIDATIETSADGGSDGESELEELIKGLAEPIDNGHATLILCKSYQKYASLGSAKVMAGNVTVIGTDEAFAKGASFAKEAEDALDFRSNDESQLLVHMIHQGSDHELDMVKHASENAGFLSSVCVGPGKPQVHNAGIPFVMVKPVDESFVQQSLFKLGVEKRDSFGFQNSSCLPVPGQGLRINTGQESEAGLVEKFHAVCHLLMGQNARDVKYDAVQKHIKSACAKAAATAAIVLSDEPARPEELNANPKAKAVQDRKSALLSDLKGHDADACQEALNEIQVLLPFYDAYYDPGDEGAKAKSELDGIGSIQASAFALATTVLNLDPPAEAALTADLRKFIETGMETVTPDMQGRLIADWIRLSWKGLDPAVDDAGKELFAQTGLIANQLPYKEDRGKILVSALPGSALAKISEEERNKLVAALMKGLDVRSQLVIAETLIDDKDFHKAEAVLNNLKKPMDDLVSWAKGNAAAFETLASSGMLGDMAPDSLTPAERERLAALYEQLKKRHKEQMVVSKRWVEDKESSILEKCAAYTKALDALDLSDPAEVKYLDFFEQHLVELKASEERRKKAEKISELETIRVIEKTLSSVAETMEAKNTLSEMRDLVPSVAALTRDTANLARLADESEAGLGKLITQLADLMTKGKEDSAKFLTDHASVAKSSPEAEAFLVEFETLSGKIGDLCGTISGLDPKYGEYLEKMAGDDRDQLKANLREKLGDIVSVRGPILEQLEILKILGGGFFRDVVGSLTAALPEGVLPGDAKNRATEAVTGMKKKRTYKKHEEIQKVVAEIERLVNQLPD